MGFVRLQYGKLKSIDRIKSFLIHLSTVHVRFGLIWVGQIALGLLSGWPASGLIWFSLSALVFEMGLGWTYCVKCFHFDACAPGLMRLVWVGATRELLSMEGTP